VEPHLRPGAAVGEDFNARMNVRRAFPHSDQAEVRGPFTVFKRGLRYADAIVPHLHTQSGTPILNFHLHAVCPGVIEGIRERFGGNPEHLFAYDGMQGPGFALKFGVESRRSIRR
jgi:hypothetical protein